MHVGEIEVTRHTFLTSDCIGGEALAAPSTAFSPEDDTLVSIGHEVAPETVWTWRRRGKSANNYIPIIHPVIILFADSYSGLLYTHCVMSPIIYVLALQENNTGPHIKEFRVS
jgi:hypothetical protein